MVRVRPAVDLSFAEVEVPHPGEAWRVATVAERHGLVMAHLPIDVGPCVRLLKTSQSGSVIMELTQHVLAASRGKLLMRIEQAVKHYVDPAITVWLEPKGDKNALRLLRGIEVKEDGTIEKEPLT